MELEPDVPAVNWFISVLGKHDPNEKDMSFEGGKYTIQCNSLKTKSLITDLAQLYKKLERENYESYSEQEASVWIPASESPDGPHSSRSGLVVMVTSPQLLYILPGGIAFGYHNRIAKMSEDIGWYIFLNGKTIKHNITHWRHLPPTCVSSSVYEDIKHEVEALKKAADLVTESE